MVSRRVPLYLQIYDTLKARIEGGDLPLGTRLPNQRALSAEFGVTLMTCRQALELLEKDGLIRRRHGLGTFVAVPPIDYDLFQNRAFASDLLAQGEQVETRLLRGRFLPADSKVRDALRLGMRVTVYCVERLRLVRRRPMVYQVTFLAPELGNEVARHDLRQHSLRHVLEDKLGVDLKRAHETTYAVRLKAPEARELGKRAGDPAFLAERVSFGGDERPLVFDRSYIPGDRFRLIRELSF